MAISILKTFQGKKRFIKSGPLDDIYQWPENLAKLKNWIQGHTSLQMIGNKVYFEFTDQNSSPYMLLPVIGPPQNFEQKSLLLIDFDECDAFIHKIADKNIFNLDFKELLSSSFALRTSLKAKFMKENEELSTIFQIVLVEDKIELHFFRQKDYIQKQF